MRVAERYQRRTDIGGGNDSLASSEHIVWTDSGGAPLRLVEVRDTYPPHVRLEGHMDDNATYSTLVFTSDDAERRARLYLACYSEADGFERPTEDPAHSVPVELLNLPRRYHAAYLVGATTNSAEWVAWRLSPRDDDVSESSVYSYCSRVRSEHPEVFE